MATFTSRSAAETESLGRKIACDLRKGDVLALVGELGAGKTQLVKGVVEAIGSSAQVTSPTFTLIHEYSGGRLPVYHLDLFRIDSRESLERLGLDEYFFGDGVCLVEWADKFPEVIPVTAKWIRFFIKNDRERKIEN